MDRDSKQLGFGLSAFRTGRQFGVVRQSRSGQDKAERLLEQKCKINIEKRLGILTRKEVYSFYATNKPITRFP
jgi:hypothetical protein